jgi:hypothetical protein
MAFYKTFFQHLHQFRTAVSDFFFLFAGLFNVQVTIATSDGLNVHFTACMFNPFNSRILIEVSVIKSQLKHKNNLLALVRRQNCTSLLALSELYNSDFLIAIAL